MAAKTATAEPQQQTRTEPKRRVEEKTDAEPRHQPPYHVILWNDNDHTYDYVVAMLGQLFGHPMEKAFQMAEEVDTLGRVIVLTTTREHAELKRDQIHAFGKDRQVAECRGSMSATIEPADDGE